MPASQLPAQLLARLFALGVLLSLVSACTSTTSTATTPRADTKPPAYGSQAPEVLEAYERGWSQILDEGRWTDSERSFREAATLDPDFVLGRMLVARITQDLDERKALLADLETRLDEVDPDTRLLLETFLWTVRAMNARDEGRELEEPSAEARMALALDCFERFVERHPDATYIQAERIEFINKQDGPQAALDAMRDDLPAGVRKAPFFNAYAAQLEARLGHHDEAAAYVRAYEKQLDDPEAPGLASTRASLLAAQGRLVDALAQAERACALDPKHLIAQRLVLALREQIDETSTSDEG